MPVSNAFIHDSIFDYLNYGDGILDFSSVSSETDQHETAPLSCGTSFKIPAPLSVVPLPEQKSIVKRAYWTNAIKKQNDDSEVTGPCVLSKTELFDEIKWSLTSSVSPVIFTGSSTGIISFNENCHVDGLSQGCLRSILDPIGKAASARVDLEQFEKSCTKRSLPPTLAAVRSWLSDFLIKWKNAIIDLSFESLLRYTIKIRPHLEELMNIHMFIKPMIFHIPD